MAYFALTQKKEESPPPLSAKKVENAGKKEKQRA